MTQPRPTSTLGFVAFIVFIDMVGIGLIVPVMPSLLETLTGKGADRTAEIGGWLLFAYAVMQFLFAPVIGGLSDRFGRRPVLLGTLFLLGIDYAIMAAAPTLAWLFAGRLVSGVMGASWTAANSCVADVVSREERGRFFGLLGGAGAAGFVIGPALGGLLGSWGERLPFVVAAIFAIGGAMVGYFILRETLPVERRRSFSASRANPIGAVVQMAKTPVVFGFLIVIFLMQMASQSQLSIWAYYNTLRFGWSALQIGLSVALFGIMLVVVQGVVVGRVIGAIGAKRTCMTGILFGVPAYLLFAFASAGWMMVLGVVFGGLTGLSFPAMQQLMTERIDENAQGELQGAIASMIGITAIIGPPLMTQIFGAYADPRGPFFPGAPFVLAAIILTLAIVLLYTILRRLGPVARLQSHDHR